MTKVKNLTVETAEFYSAKANRLLAALPDDDDKRLQPKLELVDSSPANILYDFGDEMKYLYFPITGIVSLLYTTANGSTAEMGMVGRCGVVSISTFLGGKTTANQAIGQMAGNDVQNKI